MRCTTLLALSSAAHALVATTPAQDLCSWIVQRGGSAAVIAGPTKHGLGLLASEPLSAGDAAVSIPSDCVLSAARVLESSPQRLTDLHAAVPDEFWAARLALVLLSERSRGDGAHLAPYVRTLPAAFTVPLFWSPAAIKTLQYPTVQQSLLKTAKFVQSFTAESLGPESTEAFNGLAVGADAFGWAVAACSSRAFRVGGGERVLCPIIDLGNHAPKGEANCEVRGTLGGAVELARGVVAMASPRAADVSH